MKIQDCDLLERVRWITDAVSQQDLGLNALTSYFISTGHIHATDGRMVVGTPFPFNGPDVLVPAKEFERVLTNRPEGDFSWEREEDRLVLKRGRFKGRIKTLPLDNWVLPTATPVGLTQVPDTLLPALRALLPFVSENATKPWALCAALIGEYCYASNNIVVARSHTGVATPFPEYLLPRWVCEFILKREEGLLAWVPEPERVTFLWEDGSWMRSSLIMAQYPPVQVVLDKYLVPDYAPHLITEEWKKTLRRIWTITDDPVIRLRRDEMRGVSGEVLSVEDDAGTPCPDGIVETIWDLRFLNDVLDVADSWDPTRYPQPAPWSGSHAEGIIMPRRD